jgi:hypothetical protein
VELFVVDILIEASFEFFERCFEHLGNEATTEFTKKSIVVCKHDVYPPDVSFIFTDKKIPCLHLQTEDDHNRGTTSCDRKNDPLYSATDELSSIT